MSLRMAADLPLAGDELSLNVVPDITVESLMSEQQTSSASGLLPLVTLFRSPTVSKKIHAGSTMVNERVLSSNGPHTSFHSSQAKHQAKNHYKKECVTGACSTRQPTLCLTTQCQHRSVQGTIINGEAS